MSATLPNLNVVAYWLDADLYRTDYRPVPLTELVKIGTDIYDRTVSNRLRSISPSSAGRSSTDDGDVVPLCLETVSAGCSVLIFCPTKNWCEKLADSIAREFYRLLNEFHAQETGFVKVSELVPLKLNFEMLRDVIEQLKRTPVGVDTMLAKTIPLGVAFHHAGLTFDERDIIEGAFRNGALRVLVATSTLSSGVNLPARRVIVRTPIFHGTVIDTLTYKQMIGRAGRKGIDICGESILICKPSEKNAAKSLAGSELPPVRSCLFSNGESANLSSSMKRAVLEIIVSQVAKTPEEVETYAECTLLAATIACEGLSQADRCQPADRSSAVKPYITYLLDSEFVTRHSIINPDGSESVNLVPTQLGSAVVASALSPDEGLAVFAELQKARRCFVLENELHTVYLVTPLYAQDQWGNIDWMQYLCLWEHLSADMKRVAELVGIQERYLARAVRSGGTAPRQTAAQARTAAIHRRFYAAMALHDLATEMPLPEVVKKYGCTRGVLQSLQQSAATFAGMVTVFCNRLGWYNLELLLAQFQSRLSFGVQRELIDLVRISLLNAQRARAFFNAGYQTIASLASAQPCVVEQIIRNSAPFLSKKKAEDEAEWELQERCKSRCIWLTGQKGLTEYDAAVLIIQEAKELLASDLLQMGVDWKPAECGPSKPVEKKKRQSLNGKRGQRASLKCSQVESSRRHSRNKGDSENQDPNGSATHSKTILTPPLSMNFSRRLSLEDQLADRHNKVERKEHLDLPSFADQVAKNGDLSFKPADTDNVAQKEQHCVDSKFSAENDPAQAKIVRDKLQFGIQDCMKQTIIPSISEPSDFNADEQDTAVVLFDGKIGCQTSDASSSGSPKLREVKLEPVKATSSPVTPAGLERNTVAVVLSVHNESVVDQSLERSNSNIFLDSDIVKAISSPMTVMNNEETPVLFAEAPEMKSDVIAKIDVQTGGTSDTHEPANFNTSLDCESGSVICQYMKNFCTQGLAVEGAAVNRPVECGFENAASEPADTVAQIVVSDNSFALTSDLLPASVYDRENNTSAPAVEPNAGYSENMLFDDDYDVTTRRDVRKNSPKSRARVTDEAAAMLCDSSICEEEIINADLIHDNHSDLFTSFIEDHSFKQTTDAVGSPVSEKPAELQENMNDDSLVGTLLEKALALAPLTTDGDLRGDDIVNNFSKAKSDSCGVNSVPVKSDSDSKQIVKSSIGHNVQLVLVDEVSGHCSPKKWPCNGSDFTASAHFDALRQSHSPVKQSPKTGARIQNKLPERTSKRKADDDHLKRKRQRKENADPHSADSSKCPNVSLNCASASDSSSYIAPTPPSIAKNALASNTPRRFLGGVSGTTPKKGNVLPANSRRKVGNDSISSDAAGECGSAADVSKKGGERTKAAACGVSTQSASQLPSSGQSFTVIDVAASCALFENFIAEWRNRETFSLSLACEKVPLPAQAKSAKANCGIGAKFSRATRKSVASPPSATQQADGILIEDTDVALVGLAVSWECYDAYYISLTASTIAGDLDGSMMAPPLDESLSVADRLAAIRSVLSDSVGRTDRTQCVTVFDIREQYKLLSQCCGVALTFRCMDPKVACWLLDPASNEKNLHSMVTNYCPQEVHLLQGVSCGTGLGSIGITPVPTSSGRLRACLESVLVNSVMACLLRQLADVGLHQSFVDVEMPSLMILTKMELNGMGFNLAASEDQKSMIQAKLSALEDRAYQLAGHPFSLTSVDDVGQVLFVELRLPPPGDVQSSRSKPETRKTTAASRRAKPTWSTAKEVLEKLKTLHPLPGILLEWRRLTAALTKVVFPLQKARIRCDRLSMDRIHSAVDTFTATGRVTMHEPNLQNIPKDFDIDVTAPIATPRQKRVSRSRCSSASSLLCASVQPSTNSYSVSMRNSFVSFSGGVLLAADYSQLELRIIAHLSGDRKLLKVLNGGGDVFRIIASQWKMISVDDVTDVQRQQAKQVCYGMIYGIGAQALGEQLGVDENEAAVFIESFKTTFSGLRSFLRDTVQSCRRDGFVKTILGRRRYLPAINSTNHHAKAHAERQAVNTTVQGSGADLVKTAMIKIDDELTRRFPDTIASHRHPQHDVLSSRGSSKQKRLAAAPPRGAYFILQLHDELIYEVNVIDMREVCRIVKHNMETAMKLSVKLPVKLKAGPSWGSMVDIEM